MPLSKSLKSHASVINVLEVDLVSISFIDLTFLNEFIFPANRESFENVKGFDFSIVEHIYKPTIQNLLNLIK
jgi:hypothetical protein